MIDFKRFTSKDYTDHPGATKFKSGAGGSKTGAEPCIAKLTVDGFPGVAIADRNGCTVKWRVEISEYKVHGGISTALEIRSAMTRSEVEALFGVKATKSSLIGVEIQ